MDNLFSPALEARIQSFLDDSVSVAEYPLAELSLKAMILAAQQESLRDFRTTYLA